MLDMAWCLQDGPGEAEEYLLGVDNLGSYIITDKREIMGGSGKVEEMR